MGTGIILLKKECPFCIATFTRHSKARYHLFHQHQKVVVSAGKSSQPKRKDIYQFNPTNIAKYPGVQIKYTCVSCVSNFDTKQEYAIHIEHEHIFKVPTPMIPPPNARWILQQHNISEIFHEYRIKYLQSTGYTIENNFNEILVMSGILVLQKRFDYQRFPSILFSPKLLRDMHQYLMQKTFYASPFNPQQFVQVKNIILNYVNDQLDEDSARMQLLGICKSLNEEERGVIRAIVGLIPALYDCDMKIVSELHFSASFVHPFIQGLLPSKQPPNVPHCSNIIPDEHKTHRPDYKIDIYEAYQYAYTNLYGEIKPSKDISPTLLVNDFYRVAIFCKDAMDRFNLENALGFHFAGIFGILSGI
ncbi:unnamed protein product [Rhizopus stolonifer]